MFCILAIELVSSATYEWLDVWTICTLLSYGQRQNERCLLAHVSHDVAMNWISDGDGHEEKKSSWKEDQEKHRLHHRGMPEHAWAQLEASCSLAKLDAMLQLALQGHHIGGFVRKTGTKGMNSHPLSISDTVVRHQECSRPFLSCHTIHICFGAFPWGPSLYTTSSHKKRLYQLANAQPMWSTSNAAPGCQKAAVFADGVATQRAALRQETHESWNSTVGKSVWQWEEVLAETANVRLPNKDKFIIFYNDKLSCTNSSNPWNATAFAWQL